MYVRSTLPWHHAHSLKTACPQAGTYSSQQKKEARFRLPEDFMPESSVSSQTTENPLMRLSGAILAHKISSSHLINLVEKSNYSSNIFLRPRSQSSIEAIAASFRNTLAQILHADDEMRCNKASTTPLNDENFQHPLEQLLEVSNRFLHDYKHIKQNKYFGELAKIHTAVKSRLQPLLTPLCQEEKHQLLTLFKGYRKKAAMHLVPSATKKLAEMDENSIKAYLNASHDKRLEFLDLICPLHLGVNSDELDTFIQELDSSFQELIRPLKAERNSFTTNDKEWLRLINKAINTRAEYLKKLSHVDEEAYGDLNLIEKFPDFGRLLLHFGNHFSDNFYLSCYVMKYISIDAYFKSPHMAIMLEEFQIHRQIFAARDQLESCTKDPLLLKILTTDENTNEPHMMYVNNVPFNEVYTADDFQRLLNQANRQLFNNQSSGCLQNRRIYYLPKRGIMQYDPTDIPDSGNLTPFTYTADKKCSVSPAVSYRNENSAITATHAFIKLQIDGKIFYPGKFWLINNSYQEISNKWKFFAIVIPNLLNGKSASMLNPDQNTGYPDRLISTLDVPITLNEEQKEKILSLIQSFGKGHEECSIRTFVGHRKNCTDFSKEVLSTAGISFPWNAPLHALLKIQGSKFAPLVKWAQNHPKTLDVFLKGISTLLGATKENRLTAEALNNIQTPYVGRIYMAYKNAIEMASE